jgi:hypothetical protein
MIRLADTKPIISVCHFHLLNSQRDLEQLCTGNLKTMGRGALVHTGPYLSSTAIIFIKFSEMAHRDKNAYSK